MQVKASEQSSMNCYLTAIHSVQLVCFVNTHRNDHLAFLLPFHLVML